MKDLEVIGVEYTSVMRITVCLVFVNFSSTEHEGRASLGSYSEMCTPVPWMWTYEKGEKQKREMIEAKLVVLSLSVCKGSDNISK